jgi:predicted membrane-bound spermidine synthase
MQTQAEAAGSPHVLKPEWLLGVSAFCSGAAALMYESLWARSLSLMFGSTVQVNASIFAGFIVGLAIGPQSMVA